MKVWKDLAQGWDYLSAIAEELVETPLRSGNALDFQKNVGMMAGSVSGGNPGITVSGMLSEEAEGSTVMVVEGLDKEVKKILKIVKEVKGVGISRQKESLKECKRGNLSCKEHLACIYLRGV